MKEYLTCIPVSLGLFVSSPLLIHPFDHILNTSCSPSVAQYFIDLQLPDYFCRILVAVKLCRNHKLLSDLINYYTVYDYGIYRSMGHYPSTVGRKPSFPLQIQVRYFHFPFLLPTIKCYVQT